MCGGRSGSFGVSSECVFTQCYGHGGEDQNTKPHLNTPGVRGKYKKVRSTCSHMDRAALRLLECACSSLFMI